MFGDGANIKSIAHVDNIAAFLAFLADKPERHVVYNYADKPDLSVRELVGFVDQTLGRSKSGRISFPKPIGLLAGRLADAVSWVIKRPLPVSEVRIQKFCAPSEIDAHRAFAAGFVPPTSLEDGLSAMIREHV
jgi:nucleoside-diphosphate-sugar epimerase